MTAFDLPQRYGRWTVISKSGPKSRSGVRWTFRCDCGEERAVIRNDVISGRSKSCGRLAREITAKVAQTWTKTHGLEKSPEYRLWIDMRRRCHQPQRPDYSRYGGRGITVCDPWRFGYGGKSGFEIFYQDMGPRPSIAHTIDRVNNDGPYSPQNCRWATRRQQDRNHSSNHFVEIDGENMTMVEAAERYQINYYTLSSRIQTRGWDAKRAVTTPLRKQRNSRLCQTSGQS